MIEYISREQLQEALENADPEVIPVWISVNEKLPPNGENVLCWYEYFRYGNYCAMYQTYGIGYQYNGMWAGEVARGQKTKVLAWMPLPEPPKQQLE